MRPKRVRLPKAQTRAEANQRDALLARLQALCEALPTEALLGLLDDLTEPDQHDPRCTCPTCSGFAPEA